MCTCRVGIYVCVCVHVHVRVHMNVLACLYVLCVSKLESPCLDLHWHQEYICVCKHVYIHCMYRYGAYGDMVSIATCTWNDVCVALSNFVKVTEREQCTLLLYVCECVSMCVCSYIHVHVWVGIYVCVCCTHMYSFFTLIFICTCIYKCVYLSELLLGVSP